MLSGCIYLFSLIYLSQKFFWHMKHINWIIYLSVRGIFLNMCLLFRSLSLAHTNPWSAWVQFFSKATPAGGCSSDLCRRRPQTNLRWSQLVLPRWQPAQPEPKLQLVRKAHSVSAKTHVQRAGSCCCWELCKKTQKDTQEGTCKGTLKMKEEICRRRRDHEGICSLKGSTPVQKWYTSERMQPKDTFTLEQEYPWKRLLSVVEPTLTLVPISCTTCCLTEDTESSLVLMLSRGKEGGKFSLNVYLKVYFLCFPIPKSVIKILC